MRTLLFGICLGGMAVACGQVDPSTSKDHRVGAYETIDATATDVMDAASLAVQAINAAHPGSLALQLNKVISAESQVVAGVNYRLRLELSRAGQSEVHEVLVFVQSWTNTRTLVSDVLLP